MEKSEVNKSNEIKELLSILNEDIPRDQIKLMLKLGADSMMHGTYGKMLKTDKEYNEACAEIQKVWNQYMELNITSEERKVMDTLIDRNNEANFDSVVNAYMAGIFDGYRLLKSFDLTRE